MPKDRKNGEPPGGAADPLAGLRFSAPAPHFSIATIDPRAKPFTLGDKARDRQRADEIAQELDALQNVFYADHRYKLLVVLQGMDTSGKDGTLRKVLGRMSPIGVRTVAWKAPTENERAHDFLWRIHQQVPGAGEIVAFNRSHYEDVLVPLVKGQLDEAGAHARYGHINDFERMLTDSGTVILKFLLHISRDEQRQRLQARIDDPAKRWKFQREDLDVRRHWDLYMLAYQHMVAATATAWAPWIVVPADSKSHRDVMVATVIRDAMKKLDLRFPDEDPEIAALRVE